MGRAEGALAGGTGAGERGRVSLERWLPALGGLLLLGAGVRRRGVGGLLLGEGGVGLTHLALSGEAGLSAALGLTPTQAGTGGRREVALHHALTIHTPRSVVAQHWLRLEAVARAFAHVERVEPLGAGRTYWVVRGPGGTRVRWVAELTVEEAERRFRWRTLPGSDVVHHGAVHLADAPGAWGTEVRVDVVYQPPASRLGRLVGRALGAALRGRLAEDLRHFKQLLETGEVATNARGPAGHRTLLGRALVSGLEEARA